MLTFFNHLKMNYLLHIFYSDKTKQLFTLNCNTYFESRQKITKRKAVPQNFCTIFKSKVHSTYLTPST